MGFKIEAALDLLEVKVSLTDSYKAIENQLFGMTCRPYSDGDPRWHSQEARNFLLARFDSLKTIREVINWAIENNLPIPLDEANLVEAKLRFL